GVDTNRPDIVTLQRRQVVAHGDKLVSSAGSPVRWVKHQHYTGEASQVRQAKQCALGILEFDIRRWLPGLDQHRSLLFRRNTSITLGYRKHPVQRDKRRLPDIGFHLDLVDDLTVDQM